MYVACGACPGPVLRGVGGRACNVESARWRRGWGVT